LDSESNGKVSELRSKGKRPKLLQHYRTEYDVKYSVIVSSRDEICTVCCLVLDTEGGMT